jgi:hypothetical protein
MTADRPLDPGHPDLLLAAYADDSASADERAAVVEAHLATCAECREEVQLARSAHAALRSLPQLEEPGVSADVIAALGLRTSPGVGPASSEAASLDARAAGTRLRSRAQRRARREDRLRARTGRILWRAGAAVAAVLIGVGIYLGTIVGGGGETDRAAGPAPAPAIAPAEPTQGFTPETVDALAADLATQFADAEGRSGTELARSVSPSPDGGAQDASARGAESCLRQGSGLQEDAQLAHLVQNAVFQGTPAHLGAFTQAGADPLLVVIVVSAEECLPLYSVAHPL